MPTNWDSIENAPFTGDPRSKQNHNVAEWGLLKQKLLIGSIITGKIYARVVFGVFYDADLGFPVRMNITDFGVYKEGGMVFPDDYPALDSIMRGQFCGFDELNHQLVVGRIGANLSTQARPEEATDEA